jgi:histidinol-phosphate aminotransferase
MRIKMMINKLLRENIRNLKPYYSARIEYSAKNAIFLDANENSIGSVLEEGYNRYPDPLHNELRSEISTLKKIDTKSIFLGNGSDEAIDLLIRAFCEPKDDEIILCPPTYGIYSVSANINNVNIVQVPLTSQFDLDLNGILNSLTLRTKMIFLCSPNNPTANIINPEKILLLLEKFPGLVIIDEAYIDFASTESWIKYLSRYQKLVILQTFSKAWGLANLRLGMAFADPELITVLDNIKYPYNLSGVIQKLVLSALKSKKNKEKIVAEIIQQRLILQTELEKLDLVKKVYTSEANFLLVKVDNASFIYEKLMNKKIIVRNRSNLIHCKNCIRITVGTAGENKNLIDTLKSLDG